MKTVFKLLALILLPCAITPSVNAQNTREVTGSAPVIVNIVEKPQKELPNWEITAGVEFAAFRYYHKYPYSSSSGSRPFYNFGTGGFPLGINYYMRKNENFSWMLSGHFAFYDSQRLDLCGGVEYRKEMNWFWDFKADARVGIAHFSYDNSWYDYNAVDLLTNVSIGFVYNKLLSLELHLRYSPTFDQRTPHGSRYYNYRLWGFSIGYYL